MIIDMRKMKYECVLAYCHEELTEANKIFASGGGTICTINERNARRMMKYICRKIESLKCTKADIQKKALVLPIKKYYNSISKFHDKFFKAKDSYIPAMLVLELLRLYSEKGYKEFAKIDFLKYESYFEKFKNEKGLLPKHFKTAEAIVQGLDKVKLRKN